ncbi:MAG: HAD family hydrolase [Candidatus Nanopelagicaceae bacterium]
MTSLFFEAVLFDMDGLTVNSEPQWLEAETELTAQYGYQWTIEDQAYCLGGPLSKVGKYMSDLVEGVEDGEFFHRELVNLMVEKVSARVNFMPGAQELLKQLDLISVPLALVSASPRSIVDAALKHISPLPFRATISSDDVSKTKPDPEGYLKAANFLNVDIAKCLILEDSMTGVTAARASGAKVVAVPHLVEIFEDSQTRVVTSLEEINLDLLREFFTKWF